MKKKARRNIEWGMYLCITAVILAITIVITVIFKKTTKQIINIAATSPIYALFINYFWDMHVKYKAGEFETTSDYVVWSICSIVVLLIAISLTCYWVIPEWKLG